MPVEGTSGSSPAASGRDMPSNGKACTGCQMRAQEALISSDAPRLQLLIVAAAGRHAGQGATCCSGGKQAAQAAAADGGGSRW